MKTDRLIGILSVLLQNEKMTAARLAEKFEVSPRTIYRDIDDLCRAGIPIAAVACHAKRKKLPRKTQKIPVKKSVKDNLTGILISL